MVRFDETMRGQKFYDVYVPRITKSLETIADRLANASFTPPEKVYVYKEYDEDLPYGEGKIEVYAEKSLAEKRLRRSVEEYFTEKWDDIPGILGKGDIFSPDHVSYSDCNSTIFWIVEEKTLQKGE